MIPDLKRNHDVLYEARQCLSLQKIQNVARYKQMATEHNECMQAIQKIKTILTCFSQIQGFLTQYSAFPQTRQSLNEKVGKIESYMSLPQKTLNAIHKDLQTVAKQIADYENDRLDAQIIPASQPDSQPDSQVLICDQLDKTKPREELRRKLLWDSFSEIPKLQPTHEYPPETLPHVLWKIVFDYIEEGPELQKKLVWQKSISDITIYTNIINEKFKALFIQCPLIEGRVYPRNLVELYATGPFDNGTTAVMLLRICGDLVGQKEQILNPIIAFIANFSEGKEYTQEQFDAIIAFVMKLLAVNPYVTQDVRDHFQTAFSQYVPKDQVDHRTVKLNECLEKMQIVDFDNAAPKQKGGASTASPSRVRLLVQSFQRWIGHPPPQKYKY